jgi:hypothetical protein
VHINEQSEALHGHQTAENWPLLASTPPPAYGNMTKEIKSGNALLHSKDMKMRPNRLRGHPMDHSLPLAVEIRVFGFGKVTMPFSLHIVPIDLP